jgi:FMN phosphatase YigB (HAD superfamily)
MKPSAVIFDIDNTLCDVSHRQYLLRQEPRDWDAFYDEKAMMDDPVIEPVAKIWRGSKQFAHRFMITGRMEYLRGITDKWLTKNDLDGYNKLFMRAQEDYRDDCIVKREIYEQYIQPFYDVLFVVEDRNRVVKMWRDIGLTCLQCRDGDF